MKRILAAAMLVLGFSASASAHDKGALYLICIDERMLKVNKTDFANLTRDDVETAERYKIDFDKNTITELVSKLPPFITVTKEDFIYKISQINEVLIRWRSKEPFGDGYLYTEIDRVTGSYTKNVKTYPHTENTKHNLLHRGTCRKFEQKF